MQGVEVRHSGKLHTTYRYLSFPESKCNFNLKITFKNCPSYAFKFLEYLVRPQCSGTEIKQMVQDMSHKTKGLLFSAVHFHSNIVERIQSSVIRPERQQELAYSKAAQLTAV